jgi:hypothetical protein
VRRWERRRVAAGGVVGEGERPAVGGRGGNLEVGDD